jgi:hypothetical protein
MIGYAQKRQTEPLEVFPVAHSSVRKKIARVLWTGHREQLCVQSR